MKKKQEQASMSLREHYSGFKNQAEAADDIGVTTNCYQLWLSGKFSPCFKSIQKLVSRGIRIDGFPD